MSVIDKTSWINLINSPQKGAKKPAPQNKKIKPKLEQKPLKNHHDDPLSKYPLRGLAYTNEVGVAIMDVLPKLGAALWVPALMYFGADIYNKYAQGRKGDYSDPSARKGLERAVFQGLASVILPTAAILGGKKATSKIIEKFGKDKLTPESQQEILKAIERKIGEGSFKGTTKDTVCEKVGKPILKLIDLRRNQKDVTFSYVHFKDTPKMKKKNVKEFIDNNIEEVLDLKKALRGEKVEGRIFSKKYFKLYEKYLAESSKESANNAIKAERNALRKTMQVYVSKKLTRPKTIKTIGGFIALIGLALPIDYLVEEVILKNYVKPGLDFVEKKIEENPNLFFLGKRK